MDIQTLTTLIEGKLLNPDAASRPVDCALTCDLLSWVMAKGKLNCAWVTVQTHLNVIAVASLHEMACVICPEGIVMEEESLSKASEELIAVITTELSAYKICGLLYAAGIPCSAEQQ